MNAHRDRLVVQTSDINTSFSTFFMTHWQTFFHEITKPYENIITATSSGEKLVYKTTSESSFDSSNDQIDIELFLPRCNFTLCDLLTLGITSVCVDAAYKCSNNVTMRGSLRQIHISSLLETSKSLPLFLLQPTISSSSSLMTLEPSEGLIFAAQLAMTQSNQTFCQIHLHVGDVFLSPPPTHTLSRFLALISNIFPTSAVSSSAPATVLPSTRSIPSPPSSMFVPHVTVCVNSVSVVLSLPSAATTTTLTFQHPTWTLNWESDNKSYRMQFHIRAVTLRFSSSNICILSLPNVFFLFAFKSSLPENKFQTCKKFLPSLFCSWVIVLNFRPSHP